MKNFGSRLSNSLCILLVSLCSAFGSVQSSASETLHITPAGAGSQNGSNWENAGTLARLSTFISAAGPGGSVLLRADAGPYRPASVINLRRGGGAGEPVTVRGVDVAGNAMQAEIVGDREEPYDPEGEQGSEVFRLLPGADNLTFEHLHFRNIGNGAFRIGADIENLTIRHAKATNVTRFIENLVSGGADTASINGLSVRDTEVRGFSRGVARLRYDSSDILFEDVFGDSEHQDRANFAIGVHLDGTVHDAVFRRVEMRNARDTLHEYQNGDGFATESGTYGVRFEDTIASGNTDAGYDLKSTDTVLVRPAAEGNKRNYRIWGQAIIENCVGISPKRQGGTGSQTQVWVGRHGEATLNSCAFSDDDPSTIVFQVEDTATLTVSNPVISKNRDAELSRVEPGATLTGCCSSAPSN